MKKTVAALLASALMIGTIAGAQTPTRVRGTLSGVANDVLTVKALDGKNVDVRIGEKTTIVFAQPMPISEIKAGDFLAVTSVTRGDGTKGVAREFTRQRRRVG